MGKILIFDLTRRKKSNQDAESSYVMFLNNEIKKIEEKIDNLRKYREHRTTKEIKSEKTICSESSDFRK